MIQHARRKIARIIPANPEASIPLAALVQTSISCAFQATLRLSLLLQLALILAAVARTDLLHPQMLMMLIAVAWADRSTVSYLRVWRRG
ncbi:MULTISPECIES: hypothetical protein [unclassified Streptomyces]|uniref:hypothetical protein n=1 Tax=unclassified Streptomyces TaxID=2593676 RepID=UPI000978D8C8|nr:MULTISPECIES: hypothetical protein [unclassified Streptomyces]ONI50037.1 hypothetical protein STIB_57510 [Streptomyces sp. IB2014 011-1]RDV48601.1 hypothetical protein DDV98_27585 [Streptomyces sp. IB2014 011-12]